MQGLEEEQTIRMTLERRLGQKWEQLHASCLENDLDEQRWIMYAQLKMKDEIGIQVQRILTSRLYQLSTAMTLYSDGIKNRHQTFQQDQQQLLDRRNVLHTRREQLRAKLLRQQQHHTDMLKAVSSSSAEAAEYLQALVRLGLSILRSSERCNLLKPILDKNSVGESTERVDNSDDLTHFQRFWTRFNKAYLEMILLQRHQVEMRRRRAKELDCSDNHLIGWCLNGKTIYP